MPYIGKKPADIIATVIDTTTGTFSGEVDAGSLDVSGNADIDGITNLDNTDIDGTLDVSGNLTVDTNTLFVDATNNSVGVGTSSPQRPLHIAGTNNAFVRIQDTDNNADTDGLIGGLEIRGADGVNAGIFQFSSNLNRDIDIGNETSTGALDFRTNSTQRMRIDSSGNVGIGTDSPTEKLDLVGGSLRIQRGSDTDTIVRLDGADGSTEYLGLGIASGNGVITGGGVGSTNTGLVFKTATSGTETERMRITAEGRVMIAETSNSGYSNNADDLIVGDNGASTERGISLGSTTGASIRFNDGADSGSIEYVHSSNHMLFVTNGSERMRIDSAGRVGIGVVPTAQFSHNILQIGNQATLGANSSLSTTGQTYLTHNLYYDTGGTLQVYNTSSANEGALLQMLDGTLKFSNSSATTGTPTVTERMKIDSNGSITTTAASGNMASFSSTTNAVEFKILSPTANVVRLDTGTSDVLSFAPAGSECFRLDSNGDVQFLNSDANVRLYWDKSAQGLISAGAGISFDAGANYLDDYEEGTFAPVLEGSISNPTYSGGEAGRYTKVGNIVHFSAFIDTNPYTADGSGSIYFANLPFTVDGTNGGGVQAINVSIYGQTIGSGNNLVAQAINSTDYLQFRVWGNNVDQTIWTYATASISGGDAIYVQGHYYTTS